MAKIPIVPLFVALPVVSGLIAYLVYRRSTKVAIFDLRAELHAERAALRADLAALAKQLDAAKRLLGEPDQASGALPSEGLQPRRSELQSDYEEAALLESQAPLADTDFAGLSDMALEIRLVEILALSLRVNALSEKYPAARPFEEADRVASGGQVVLPPTMPLIAPI